MKIAILMVSGLFASGAMAADTYVNGYTKADGTYVAPHYQTKPDNNAYNNYSAQGNTNPYTGQAGTIDPVKTQSNYGHHHKKSAGAADE